MRDSKSIQVVAGVVTLGAVVAVALTLRGGLLPSIEPGPHEAAGWAAARQALSLLKPEGNIMVIVRDTAAFQNPATDIQLASFRKELRKSGAAVSAIQLIQVDPLRPVEVPPGDFLEWIRKSPAGGVIVSFMGPPLLSDAQRRQLREIKPSIVAFCPGGQSERVSLQALFKQGLLHAAIVSQRNPAAPATQPEDMQAWFDQHFTVVTGDNVGDWVASAGNPP